MKYSISTSHCLRGARPLVASPPPLCFQKSGPRFLHSGWAQSSRTYFFSYLGQFRVQRRHSERSQSQESWAWGQPLREHEGFSIHNIWVYLPWSCSRGKAHFPYYTKSQMHYTVFPVPLNRSYWTKYNCPLVTEKPSAIVTLCWASGTQEFPIVSNNQDCIPTVTVTVLFPNPANILLVFVLQLHGT
jgi:hypothetical protein